MNGLLCSGLALMIALGPLSGASAQDSSAEPALTSRLVTLATAGGPVARPHRAGIASLIAVGKTHYLIDAGEGLLRQLARLGVQPQDVRQIFFTHLHDDHTAGLAGLIGFGYSAQYPGPVNIYGPPLTERMVKGLEAFLEPNTELRMAGLKMKSTLADLIIAHDVLPGVIYRDANVTVTAVENRHYNAEPKQQRSYSLRFDLPDRSIVFTGDTGPSEAVTRLAVGADILVSELVDVPPLIERRRLNGSWVRLGEAGQKQFVAHLESEHLTPPEIIKMANAAAVKKVVLSHLTMRPDEDFSAAREIVAAGFHGPVVVANDMDVF